MKTKMVARAYNGQCVEYVGERTWRAFRAGDFVGIKTTPDTLEYFQVLSVAIGYGLAGTNHTIYFSGRWDTGNCTMVWDDTRLPLARTVYTTRNRVSHGA